MEELLPQRIGAARARVLLGTGRLVSATYLMLGILGMLRTGADDLGSDSSEQLAIFTVHPLTAVIWFVLGVVGVAMSADPRRAQVYLLGAGGVLIAWGVLALGLDGSPSELFVRDVHLVVLHLVSGAVCLVAALAPLPDRVEGATG